MKKAQSRVHHSFTNYPKYHRPTPQAATVLKVKIKTLAQPWDFVLAEIAWKDILIAVPANTYFTRFGQ